MERGEERGHLVARVLSVSFFGQRGKTKEEEEVDDKNDERVFFSLARSLFLALALPLHFLLSSSSLPPHRRSQRDAMKVRVSLPFALLERAAPLLRRSSRSWRGRSGANARRLLQARSGKKKEGAAVAAAAPAAAELRIDLTSCTHHFLRFFRHFSLPNNSSTLRTPRRGARRSWTSTMTASCE